MDKMLKNLFVASDIEGNILGNEEHANRNAVREFAEKKIAQAREAKAKPDEFPKYEPHPIAKTLMSKGRVFVEEVWEVIDTPRQRTE
jgi:hypothetical protein